MMEPEVRYDLYYFESRGRCMRMGRERARPPAAGGRAGRRRRRRRRPIHPLPFGERAGVRGSA